MCRLTCDSAVKSNHFDNVSCYQYGIQVIKIIDPYFFLFNVATSVPQAISSQSPSQYPVGIAIVFGVILMFLVVTIVALLYKVRYDLIASCQRNENFFYYLLFEHYN